MPSTEAPQDVPQRDDAVASQLALANRILVNHGILDAFGHVSVRSAEQPDRFLLSRNRAPGLVAQNDIQVFGFDGYTEDERPVYLERFIHAEIYRGRPDVSAIIHSHSPAVTMWSVIDMPLEPVIHVAGFLGRGVARYEIRDDRGDATDLLIRDSASGADVARELGSAPLLLMRGHGFVTVASSLPLVVYQAIYATLNAEMLLRIGHLGRPTVLTAGEARAAENATAGQVNRAWEVWASEVEDGAFEPSR